ncbi:MAG TPA: phosphoglycerate kinase [Myxococcales bacterium]|nr:phosphoglycerate kinase [Myxococcales bacterium]
MSLAVVGARLAELLNQEILFPEECVGDGPRKLATNLREGQLMLLENLRFHAGESSNDDSFARALASLAEVYVNDAFGTVHRSHASVVAVPLLLPERAAGFLMQKELEALTRLIRAPERPFVVVVGGAKVAGKIGLISSLLERANSILIGGAMAYTFLAARGMDVGNSHVEEDKIGLAKRVLTKVNNRRTLELLLPVDHVCAPEISDESAPRVIAGDAIPQELMGLDIGPETVALFRQRIAAAKTIFWNGPMGVFEKEPFANGTMEIAKAIAHASARSCVGGGDSVSAVRKAGVTPFIGHISTGGGAGLEFLQGKELPGVEALRTTLPVTEPLDD